MQVLTLKEVKENARKYYIKGLLTAQHPIPEERMCINQNGDYRCAVAASYSDETLEHISGKIENGIIGGHIEVKDPLELAAIVRIQQIHDLWADGSRKYEDNPFVKDIEETFKYLIGIYD